MTGRNEGRPASDTKRWLTPGVASVGAASFFSDAGHEIVTSVLPSFVTGVLGGSAAALGVIEGVSDALTGATKVIGGPLANDPARRRKMATGGYLVTAAATSTIGAATGVWQVGVLRALAWAARGFRSPARDALLSSLAQRRSYGRAFGVERAGDNLGAVVGPLLAAGLVAWIGIRPTIWFAFIPGILAAVAITVAAREARRLHDGSGRPGRRVVASSGNGDPGVHRDDDGREDAGARPDSDATGGVRLDLRGLWETGLARPLLPVVLFECGNLATTMLILRATEQLAVAGTAGAASVAIGLYAVHNAVAALVALLGGVWLDRSGPRWVFATGAAAYVVGYLCFASAAPGLLIAAAGFVLAGAGIGLAETAESALVARALPDRLRGSGFGVVGGVQALGNLVGTAVAGILYTAISPTVAFGYAATWMLLAVAASAWFRTPRAG
ncbi:MFS transporter [Micropruina sp.]|uniref:MFS transporter n=1 Tax=Micropruina sp. TaxID=2737536 RepID=UPI0039E6093C